MLLSTTQSLSPPISLPLSPPPSQPLTSRPHPTIQKQTLKQKTINSKPKRRDHESKSSYWVESIRTQTRSGLFLEAISTYIQMINISDTPPPDNFVFPALLKAISALQDLDFGKQIHGSVIKLGYHSSSVTVANTLIHMYGKCGEIGDVYQMFDRIPQRDQVSWNTMISALCKFEEWESTLEAFRVMQLQNAEPNSFTLVSVALACSYLNKHDGLRLDNIKAGGSEILFVRMQQKKPWTYIFRFLIRFLAAEGSKLGLQVGLILPDRPFPNNHGAWKDEFQDLELEGRVLSMFERIPLYTLIPMNQFGSAVLMEEKKYDQSLKPSVEHSLA
ncbi:hypothetical protein MKX01_004473 [Papaver californicum]|nr:hypothetical protein MKX01_004473 [Papaver californicum]